MSRLLKTHNRLIQPSYSNHISTLLYSYFPLSHALHLPSLPAISSHLLKSWQMTLRILPRKACGAFSARTLAEFLEVGRDRVWRYMQIAVWGAGGWEKRA